MLVTAVLVAAAPAANADRAQPAAYVQPGDRPFAERYPFDIQLGRGLSGLEFFAPAPGVAWTRSIRIFATGDAPANTDQLQVPPITVESEAGITVELSPGSLPPNQDLPPGASVVVKLAATFPAAGVYRGDVVLLYPGRGFRPRGVPIQITVNAKPALPAMPLEDRSAKTLAITEELSGKPPTALAIRLRNTGGEALEVTPAYSTVVRIDKPETPSYQITIPEAHEQGEKVTIPAGAYQRFELPIVGIDAPGIYTIETVFKDAGATPRYQDQAVKTTVYRRQSWLWAALAIALGAALASGARWFLSDGNKRLALRRRIALLREHIRAVRAECSNEQLIGAARLLELDVADRDRDARWGLRVGDVEPVVARAEKRLDLLRSVVAAFATLAQLDADKQAAPRKTLDDALIVVRADPGDDARISDAQKAVEGLALRGVRRDQLLARLTDLRALIAQQRSVGSAVLIGALTAVEGSLVAADGYIRTDDLDKLGALVDKALGDVLDACIAELTQLVGGAAPRGVEADDWKTAAEACKATLAGAKGTWRERNAALLEAEQRYFTAAVEGLIKVARDKASSSDSRAAELTALATDLETRLKADPLGAAAMYSQSLRKLDAADSHGPRPTAFALAPSQGVAGWIPLVLGEVHGAEAAGGPGKGGEREAASAASLGRELTTTTWAINVVVLGIAIASGLKTLWFDDLSWGGTAALVAAFLWGAGVQAAGDVAAGIAGVRAKLGAAPQA
ncbi:MAG TPA: hypothetical protein VFK02_21150 [Kofleriaceae bacterium]|nr:hypothetical protein [Kofleriaceae bacterium]